jgi:hypothetical protein
VGFRKKRLLAACCFAIAAAPFYGVTLVLHGDEPVVKRFSDGVGAFDVIGAGEALAATV